MLIRQELPGDAAAIHAVVTAAFAKPDQPTPVEADLVDWLRADPGWIPALSLVAVTAGEMVGHVLCTRARLTPAPPDPAAGSSASARAAAPSPAATGSRSVGPLGLGPLAVHPAHQRRGVGLALMHAVLGAADALGSPLVVLLGSPVYYSRFGFRAASELGVISPDPQWGHYFQARTMSSYDGSQTGQFHYAEPFSRL